MAYDKDQEEFALPADGNNNGRKSAELLPRYFRTQANKKFLASTLDQILQPGVAEKVSGYVGRQIAPAFKPEDNYVEDVSKDRSDYQLEPAVVIKDSLNNTTFYKDYNDYINQINAFGGNVENHDILNSQETYSWNPHIDWDKFTNFREYYWLPNGPQTVDVFGQTEEVESTLVIGAVDNLDNRGYVFSSEGAEQNPTIILYRGQKYRFEIDTQGLPLTIKTKRTLDEAFLFNDRVSDQAIDTGVIDIEITENTPDELFYVSENDINSSGQILIKDIEENSSINVEKEIINRRQYTTGSGFSLTNGMKIRFVGNVIPEKYATGEYYVEGVGKEITLIEEKQLEIPATYSEDLLLPFDSNGFDRVPFGNASSYAGEKDYIVINRGSLDGNPWTRYNRWFHKDVIEISAKLNNQPITVDQESRARRPIIEFEAGLKLYKFGSKTKPNVDLVDTFTKDVFSQINGQIGYNIDGVSLTDGMRVLFTADTDVLVKNKIYQVKFITHNNVRQIALIETDDTNPLENETVLATKGDTYKGHMFYYLDEKWELAQEKTGRNVSPKFDIFDEDGVSYGNTSKYEATTFTGNKVFSYKVGNGNSDVELGFPLSYRNIENVGDIVFDFNLLAESMSYQITNTLYTKNTDIGYLKVFKDRDVFDYENSWTKTKKLSSQRVYRQYIIEEGSQTNDFIVDVYKNSADLTDLNVKAFVNNSLVLESIDFEIVKINQDAVVRFVNNLNEGDVLVLKTKSSASKLSNVGYYEFPHNLERNPQNDNLTEFTLGEVNDHVLSIVTELETFNGKFPGPNNLRDLGRISYLGQKFVQHSGPINLSLYHITNKEGNIIKALKYARKEYAKFKRQFLQVAYNLGYDGPVKQHVDNVLTELVKDKTNVMPFYFSDMVAFGATKNYTYTVTDSGNEFYALSQAFDLNTLGPKSVLVYKNGEQLTYQKDYTFNDDGFCVVTIEKELGDEITLYEYESTDGSFIPPTPTKLGLYPKYVPAIYVDNTYKEPKKVIQGHDGSITLAYDDYRDNLILELERRIFNNIKQTYDPTVLNIHEYIGGQYRDTRFTRNTINNAMTSDFVQWNQRIGSPDFTLPDFYDSTDPFTFNYKYMTDVDGNSLPGFWRAVYKYAYDTDRPHTHPWEMLGFTIKPTWWEEQYGPAPYTSNNLILWKDLQEGNIRVPSKPLQVDPKYKRPSLLNHLPVDESGNLLSPLESNYAQGYVQANTKNSYTFGDETPTETAWRKSSEYPFSLITSWVLNQPSKVFGLGFDISRIKRNLSGQFVYSNTNKLLHLAKLQFPNTSKERTRSITSGLVNYVSNYLSADVTISYDKYKQELTTLQNQLGAKLAGFTDKSKFNLILDSRSPLNEGNVFVPDENYKILLNTSSATEVATYSGVIVEKQSSGFVVRGYDNTNPTFKYYQTIPLNNDTLINVGGITESFVEWTSGQQYVAGANILFNSSYYRCKNSHVSSTNFEQDNFVKLAELPLVGGQNAFFRKTFEDSLTTIPYGHLFRTIQEVVDFLLGYGKALADTGFIFDNFNSETGVVENWKLSAREFLFWTTQNWSAGTLISLSPAASRLKFAKEYAVVDNIFDNFYDYTLLKADGQKLREEFASIGRDNGNEFTIEAQNTADGIYHIKLPLVQKEHIVIIDNRTVFGDIIYDPEPGYRQDRIKVQGYKSDGWFGGLNIPGFIYDDVTVTIWEPWKDYTIGSVVKYKEFYYVANEYAAGQENFNNRLWTLLRDRPESGLVTNFEYKVNQFADFYDLDSDNFDLEQQRLAQHLVGYQKRQYLQNIINDDVSQFKFYQGFIADKGTRNAIDKLFDSLSSANKESIDFFEEWAIRKGQYGAVTGFDEVEFKLNENNFKLEPQPIDLVNSIPNDATDLIYRIRPFETYLKPSHYDHKPFPVKYTNSEVVKTTGYVNGDDVTKAVLNKDDILNLDINDIDNGNHIWIARDQQSWDVVKHIATDLKIVSIEEQGNTAKFNVNKTCTLEPDQIVGILNIKDQTSGFYKVSSVELSSFTIDNTVAKFKEISNISGLLTTFVSKRVETLSDANDIVQKYLDNDDVVWVDDDDSGKWRVLKNERVYVKHNLVDNPEEYKDKDDNINPSIGFGEAIAADDDNTIVVVGAPDTGHGNAYIYTRPSDSTNLLFSNPLTHQESLSDNVPARFGASVAVSPDGEYIAIGAPNASNVKTKYRGTFSPDSTYNKADVVQYNQKLYSANKSILQRTDNILYSSFDAYAFHANDTDSSEFNLLQLGNYKLLGSTVDHILVKAPLDMWRGTSPGDFVELSWNEVTTVNLSDSVIQPFPNNNLITSTFISQEHEIVEKVNHVFHVEQYLYLPNVGDIVSTSTATGTVVYVANRAGQATIYVNNVNGVFNITDNLFINEINRVGTYTEDYFNTSDAFGGYWLISSPAYTNSNSAYVDPGQGLVYKSIRLASEDPSRTPEYYKNMLSLVKQNPTSLNDQALFLTQLTFTGDNDNILEKRKSNLLVVRVEAGLDNLIGTDFNIWLDDINFDATQSGIPNYELINDNLHTVSDLWDGYIDFTFKDFDNSGNPFEPVVGYTVRDLSTNATAEVVFYQRDFNNVRIYVKNVQGTWSVGENWGTSNVKIQLDAPLDADPNITPNRTMGDIDAVSLGSATVGKLAVIEFDEVFDDDGIDIEAEYWIYTERYDIFGTARPANYPSSSNLDWKEVYNLPTTSLGYPSLLSNEGMVYVYKKLGTSDYILDQSFVIPERTNNSQFGKQLKFTKNNDLYTLFISSSNTQAESSTVPGSVFFVKHGSDSEGTYEWELARDRNYRGIFDNTTVYKTNEIVDFEDVLYKAITNISNSANPNASSDWELVDETVSHIGYVPSTNPLINENVKDTTGLVSFAKEFDTNNRGDVLAVATEAKSDELLVTLRGLNTKIKLINQSNVDSGYEPLIKEGATTYIHIEGDDSSANLSTAFEVVDVIDNTIAVKDYNDQFRFVELTGLNSIYFTRSDVEGNIATANEVIRISLYSTSPVLVYRQTNGHFELNQQIYATGLSAGFGSSIALSNDGKLLAIGEPYSNEVNTIQGKVYIYKLNNGQFELSQTLYSINNEKAEQFGWNLDFDGDHLAVTSLQGDIDTPTTFDSENTIFDNGFTEFKRTDINSGVVFVYQRINDTLVYAQDLNFKEVKDNNEFLDTTYFGKKLLLSNNHVYVGLPKLTNDSSYTGAIIDYRRPINTVNWSNHRTPIDQVNIDTFRGAFLYNTVTNKLVDTIDIIDPVQGRIAGPAEQEISYKTNYDPATFSTGEDPTVIIDSTNSWGVEQVGRVWWDLSTARFYNAYQGDLIYQTNYWNKLFPTTSIDVYEWVESTLLPADWDRTADTESGLNKGISGTSKYGNSAYVERRRYNKVSGTFSSVYYYWVKNKTTVPKKDFRSISIASVAQLIANPASQGYKFAMLLSNNKFALVNCADLLKDTDVAINFSYWTIDNKEQNIHNEYQLLTVGDESSIPNKDIELKWFDSLVGYDKQSRPVPDPEVGAKQKYGALNKPRQSWFINRTEALKQVVERVNSVLLNYTVVDERNLAPILASDPKPTAISRHYDITIDTELELQFVGTARLERAELEPVIVDGVITRLNIINPGKGYRVAPTYKIIGEGTGAEFEFDIDLAGKIVEARVIEGGNNYNTNTSVLVRRFTVLVESDTNVAGKWSMYERNNSEWNRILTQDFDVTLYWNYADWYATDYNEFTPITYYVDFTYELSSLNAQIGDIIKVATVGSGGWVLLERVALTNSEEYTDDYKTIGRENGTIQFSEDLYNLEDSLVGFDASSYDTQFFDSQPIKELRIILESIKNDLFIDDLAIEYNNLFFASLRYVFSEQSFVDWAFKTSFIKAKHNVGELEQTITFKNDNLPSYEDYIEEVKPFKTKIREYVSSYEGIDNSNTSTTDFDLPARYNPSNQIIEAPNIQVIDNSLVNADTNVTNEYPRKHWYDNVGFKVTSIEISDQGSGYLSAPIVKIVGGGGEGATAKAYVSSGKISKIEVLTPGSGYLSAPTIEFDGTQASNGTPAKASVIINGGVVRSTNVKFKFDRVSGQFYITDLAEHEQFVGAGNITQFHLKFPADIKTDRITVIVDGIEALAQDYTVINYTDTTKTYTRQLGSLVFVEPPVKGAKIDIEYFRDIETLQAQDRLSYFYKPVSGMPGHDLSQLMDGIDYGGVEVRSFDFGTGTGWDSDEWYTTTWDTYDVTFEDELVQLDGSTQVIELSKPLETNVSYNIYRKRGEDLNAIRLDDPNFGTDQQTNPNAVCQTITGAGQTLINIGDLNITGNKDNDLIIIRKTTSDGSFLPDPVTYDTQLSGGNLQYTSAQGVTAEEINIDGDGFVTPTTSKGPEELVPGQILDTFDMQIFERAGDGGSMMHSFAETTDGVKTRFNLSIVPQVNDGIFVKLDRATVDANEYIVDATTNELVFNTAPAAGQLLSAIVMTVGAQDILDIDTIITDGSTQYFNTTIPWNDNLGFFATLNGNETSVVLEQNEDTNTAELQFPTAPDANSVVNYGIFATNDIVDFSHVGVQKFTADGITNSFNLDPAPFYRVPTMPNIIVKVNDVVQHSGYRERFDVTARREYPLRSWQVPNVSTQAPQVQVYLNDEPIELTIAWRWDVYNSSVVLFDGVGSDGDKIDVYLDDGLYHIIDGSEIQFVTPPNSGDVIEVIQFSNHDIQNIERKHYDVVARSTLTLGTPNANEYYNLTTGLIKLFKPAVESRYVWVILNGQQLIPDVDFNVTVNKQYIKINNDIAIGDTVEIIHFTSSLVTEKFGYRQFKDMLNRVHFKRMYTDDGFKLGKDLNWYDLRIEVEDASNLPEPNKTLNIPGVIFINGERIEYMNKDGNSLRQLRRGTLGTGVNSFIPNGTDFMDQSQSENIPYRDETISTVFEATDGQTEFTLDFNTTDLVTAHQNSTGVQLNETQFFEVFVAGRRLRKNEIKQFDKTIALDSPEGDVTQPAEFSATGTTLTLTTAPTEGEKVIVVRRVGKLWSDQGKELRYANNDISRFLRDKTVSLPK